MYAYLIYYNQSGNHMFKKSYRTVCSILSLSFLLFAAADCFATGPQQAVVSTRAANGSVPLPWTALDNNFTGLALVANVANAKTLSVTADYGATANATGVDQSTYFQNALSGMGAAGISTINVGAGNFMVNTAPTLSGLPSVQWLFDLNSTISSSVSWPSAVTSTTSLTLVKPAGRWVNASPAFSATTNITQIAADTVEITEGSSANGIYTSGYFAGKNTSTSNTGLNGVRGITGKTVDVSGSYGTEIALYGETDDYSTTNSSYGLYLTGIGTANPTAAINILRADTTNWGQGIAIANAAQGISIVSTTSGVANTIYSGETGYAIAAQQFSNGAGADVLYAQRYTDTAPVGTFLHFASATGSTSLFQVDTTGAIHLDGSTVTTSSVAGTATAPGAPAGFVTFYINGVAHKIAFYN